MPPIMHNRRSGQSMVEFTLMLPLMLLLLIGIFEVGRMVLAFTVGGHAAREGAAYAAMTTVIKPPPLPATPPTGANPGRPTWNQPCNLAGSYRADDGRCLGWPNVVSTVVNNGQWLWAGDTRIDIIYGQNPATLQVGLGGYNRDVPVTVVVHHNFRPILASFIGVPLDVPIVVNSTRITQ